MKRAAQASARHTSAFPGAIPPRGGDAAASLKEHLTQAVAQQRQRQPDVAQHSHRVAQYALALGQVIGLSAAELILLGQGAQLHDWGKLWLPDQILNKPGPLTPAEFELIAYH